jgi:valyl-tRNA synthetase
VDRLLERFELGEAGREIQEFVWDELCDWYLEIAKVRLRSADEPSPMPVLVHVLDACLRLLHPFMPYVTEEIWSGSGDLRSHLMAEEAGLLLVASYPKPANDWRDEDAERELSLLVDVVRSIRNLRRERGIDAGRWLEAYVVADASLGRHAAAIEALARVRPLHLLTDRQDAPSDSVATAILDSAEVILPLAGLFDFSAERANLEKQRAQAQGEVERIEAKLADERFTSRAPAAVVGAERERLDAARARLAGVDARLSELS